jgi:hypothetical protein
MRASLNSNSTMAPSSLVEDGEAFYEKQLRASLEPKHFGEFVAIEPSSRRYFLGQTATDALVAARNAMPGSQFFLTRIGKNSAHKIGGHGSHIG